MKRRHSIINTWTLTLLAFATVVGAGLWGNVRLMREGHVMRTEIKTLRDEPAPAQPGEDATTAAEIASLSRELAEESALLQKAETELTALQETVPAVENEELRSFGGVERMGLEAAEFLPQLANFMGRNDLSDEETSRVMGTMMGWLNRVAAVGELEANASEIARFHAATLQTRLQLDGETTEKVRQQIDAEFRQLQSLNLTRPQRPDTDQDDWYRRRYRFLDEASARIEALIPPGQRQPYAIGQSLHLGTGMRTETHIGPNGHGSISMGLNLPGISPKR
jgi:hypothetical protein